MTCSVSTRRAGGALLLGLSELLLIMATLALLRWQVPAMAVATLGFPVLVGLFLRQTGLQRSQTRGTWVLVIVSGIVLGIVFAMLSGAVIARRYGVGIGAGIAGGPRGDDSLGVPLAAVLAMVVPALIVRLVRVARGGVLTGFVIGAVGASCFGAAATLVHLSPQFATGLLASHRPALSLLVEAVIRGVAIPLTSAAIGGLVGAALWFRRGWVVVRKWPALVAAAVVVGGLAAVAAVGPDLIEVWSLSQVDQLIGHLLITVGVLVITRIGVHAALVHEGRSADLLAREASGGDPVMSPVRLLLSLAATVAAVIVCAVGISAVVTKPVVLYSCPPDCGDPPLGTAIHVNPRFTAADGAFSVDYPAPGSAYEVSKGADWLIATMRAGDGGVLRLSGEPANGRSERQVVDDLLAKSAPNSTLAYEIPNAMVGYEMGYGEVADDYPQNPSGNAERLRIVAMAAVKDDYALIAAAAGPFHQFGPGFGPGPPSAVNLEIALDMDLYVNTFRWK